MKPQVVAVTGVVTDTVKPARSSISVRDTVSVAVTDAVAAGIRKARAGEHQAGTLGRIPLPLVTRLRAVKKWTRVTPKVLAWIVLPV
jgi:hypothetical protein